jgi:hypothetical protein
MQFPYAGALRRPGRRALAPTALASLALVFASSASGQTLPPTLNLGPIQVAGGVATVTGTVGGDPAGTTSVTINGQPVSVSAGGQFTKVIDLNGQSSISVTARNPVSGETSIATAPVDLGPLGGVISDALAALRRAGVQITVPPGGFQILDGLPLSIAGTVANPGELAGLRVNGMDVLGMLRPDGSFTLAVPGTTREIRVESTDRQGVSQASVFPIAAAASVPGAQATGLRIAAIRYVTRGAARTKRVRMIVTVRDQRGSLVRGATVRVASMKPIRALRPGRYVLRTGKLGRAGFWLRPRQRVFGKRLVMKAVARTAAAKAQKSRAVRVPRLARAR